MPQECVLKRTALDGSCVAALQPQFRIDLTGCFWLHRLPVILAGTSACAILNKRALFFAESDSGFTWHYTCSGQKSKRWYSSFSVHAQQTVRLYSPAFSDRTQRQAPAGCVWCQSGCTCSVSKEGYLLRLNRVFQTSGLLLHFSGSLIISFLCQNASNRAAEFRSSMHHIEMETMASPINQNQH